MAAAVYFFGIILFHSISVGYNFYCCQPNLSNSTLKMPFGKDIFVNASKYMISEVKNIMKKNHMALEKIVHLIPHQANSRIISQVVESLDLKNAEPIMNIEDMGNTGCASTMIGLSQNWSRFKKGELIVVTVFGGGYSSGAMLLERL